MAWSRTLPQRKQAEQSLAEALELNRTLVSASTVGIAAYKASGRCVIANEALARIAGGTIEQLLQQDFRRLKSWCNDGLLAKAVAALETGQPQEIETNSRTYLWAGAGHQRSLRVIREPGRTALADHGHG